MHVFDFLDKAFILTYSCGSRAAVGDGNQKVSTVFRVYEYLRERKQKLERTSTRSSMELGFEYSQLRYHFLYTTS